MGPGALVTGIFTGLGLNVLIKMVVAAIVAFGVFRVLVIPASGAARTLPAVAIIAVGGSLAFNIGVWILGELIGAIIGIVLFWIVVTVTLDQFSNVHYDQSQAYTGQIVIISVILWIIVGVIISGVQAMR